MLGRPPIALGVSVGNVAIFLFLVLAAGFRAGPLLVVGGLIKPQAAILALGSSASGVGGAIAIGLAIVVACPCHVAVHRTSGVVRLGGRSVIFRPRLTDFPA